MTKLNTTIISSRINFIIFITILILAPSSTLAGPAEGNEVFNTIVKIQTYYVEEGNKLVLASIGSGVIIIADGIVLTNSHVINHEDDTGSSVPTAIRVCYNNLNKFRPDCRFIASVLADDPIKDIALLRIKDIYKSLITLPYININYVDRPKLYIGDKVVALGYPDFGAETIVGIYGTVENFENDETNQWIVSDAITSFGSSGGALTDKYGNLLGINTLGNSKNSYAQNINSFFGWLTKNLGNSSPQNSLNDRLKELITLEDNLTSVQSYTIQDPPLYIKKPVSWIFDIYGENIVRVHNFNDESSGSYQIKWIPKEIINAVQIDYDDDPETEPKCTYVKNITLSDYQAEKWLCINDENEITILKIPYQKYYITITIEYKDNPSIIDDNIALLLTAPIEKITESKELTTPVDYENRPNPINTLEEIIEGVNSKIIWNGKKIYSDKPSILPVGYMIKADSDPASYLVMPDGTLRWVQTEAVANRIFGPSWDNYILWLDEALVYTYQFGDIISE